MLGKRSKGALGEGLRKLEWVCHVRHVSGWRGCRGDGAEGKQGRAMDGETDGRDKQLADDDKQTTGSR